MECHRQSGMFCATSQRRDFLKSRISWLRAPCETRVRSEVQTSESDNDADRPTEVAEAIDKFLGAPFSQVEPYAKYVTGVAPFDTHQGVKGLQFDRVMVITDDSDAGGFLFSYDRSEERGVGKEW